MSDVQVGMKFTKLTVVAPSGKSKWLCACDCGNEKVFCTSMLTSNHNKSCGCSVDRHGMRYHRAYKSWLHMKQRCNNPENQDYPNYGGRGITVHEDFAKSFPVWLAAIGERPEGRYSIGRIDNNLGYTYGNIRWEDDAQQSRNHCKSVVNKTGIVGVVYREREKCGGTYCTWIAQWANECNKKKTKEFSCNKYGYDVAKQLATDYRNKMMVELNIRGFDYAESHGSVKEILNG